MECKEEPRAEHVYIKPENGTDVEKLPLQTPQTTFDPDKIENETTNPDSQSDSSDQNLTDRTDSVHENGKNNQLQCPECDKTFNKRTNLKAHIKYVHATEDDVVKCNLCLQTFKSLHHLSCHKYAVHIDVPADLPCDHCDKIFPSKRKLKSHIYDCHPRPGQEVECGVCSKIYKTKYRLKIHMRQVHPEGLEVDCPHCGRRFKNPMLMKHHVKWSHPDDGTEYRCQECSKMFPSKGSYRWHMNTVHSSVNLSCDTCGKVFKSASNLNRHSTTHTGVRPPRKAYKPGDIPCSLCGKMFKTQTHLLRHSEKYHTDNQLDLYCRMCDKRLPDNYNLRRHMDTAHSMEPVSCSVCNKMYKSQFSLQRHVKVTHAPPEAAQTCDTCKKTFKCLSHLKTHMYMVHQGGSYACTICNKVLKKKSYLVKHEKTHNSKEYPCSYCMKLFTTVTDAKNHIKRVHLKNMERKCVKCGLIFEDDVGLQMHIMSCGIQEMPLQVKMEVVESEECETG